MSKIIINTIGTHGDIYPFIGLGVELLALGYEVVFITNDVYKDYVESENLTFITCGSEDEYKRSKSALFSESGRSESALYYHVPAMERSFAYVMENCNPQNTLMILVPCESYGAAAAAEKLGIPLTRVYLMPQQVFPLKSPPAPYCWEDRKYPKPIRYAVRALKYRHRTYLHAPKGDSVLNYVNGVRESVGMEKFTPGKELSCKVLEIGLFPEWFAFRASDWPKRFRTTGFPCWEARDPDAHQTISEFVNKFGKPVLFSMGTGTIQAKAFYELAQDICDELDAPCLVVGGVTPSTKPADGKFLHVQYAAFSEVLPMCLAAVHHGGIGTIAQCIRTATPQLIIPFSADQPDNALRVKKLNVGDFIMPSEIADVDRMVAAVRSVIELPKESKNLMALSASMARSNPSAQAGKMICQHINLQDSVSIA